MQCYELKKKNGWPVHVLTDDEWGVEPLYIVTFGVEQQDLIGHNGDRE